MSELVQNDINTIANKVLNLKKKFQESYMKDRKNAVHILREMRILHGKAICANYLDEIVVTNKHDPSEEDYLKLSNNESFLYVIHCHIRNCEKRMFENNEESSKPKISESKTEELSISVPQTETASESDKNYSDKISDYMKNLKLSEMKSVKDINSASQKILKSIKNSLNMNGGNDWDVNKTTIVNYWADWCGYSKNFLKTWNEFLEVAPVKYPGLQILDLNVERNKELNELANKTGVKGYPTVVIYHNGKRYIKVAGNLSLKDLEKFVDESIKSF
jgi:thiol-disulfide isomerase/thioredoxin